MPRWSVHREAPCEMLWVVCSYSEETLHALRYVECGASD
jgi:hypothetical protein